MQFIKSLGALIIVFINFIIIYKISGTHIYKLDTHISDEIDLSDSLYSEDIEIFVVQNPPSTHREMVELIYEFNKENKIESARLPPKYSQTFYKETWDVNRFFEPYFSFFSDIESNFFQGNFPNYPVGRIQFIYKKSQTNSLGSMTCCQWNLPYFEFDEVDSTPKFYLPNGTKENPNDKKYDPFVKSRKAFVD